MKKLSTIFLALVVCLCGYSQLPDGSTAPDFTLTDINGLEHSLYEDYLDQGYSVVIDFSAVWCGPCWGYHTSGALEELYVNHGPAGMPNVSEDTTDDVMVFFIEGDEDTTLDELNGIGSGTMGNWVEGTPYPIIDDASMTGPYSIGYWPTIYTICPDRTLVESSQIGTSQHYDIANACGFAQYASDMRIISLESTLDYCMNYTPTVKIQNLSTESTFTSATITVSQNGTELSSFDWEGSLETYDVEIVDLPEMDGEGLADSPLEISITVDEDLDDSNNMIEASLSRYVTSETIELELLTDNYASETSWEFRDGQGIVIASGEGYSNNTLYNETINITSVGCFTFEIFDSYGDGICCSYGEGYFKLIDDNGTELMSGGEFATNHAVKFENDQAAVVSIEELSGLNGMAVYPNPANENVTISFNSQLSKNTIIELHNVVGELVYSSQMGTISTGNQLVVVDLKEMSSGLYFVTVSNELGRLTKELSIRK